MYTTGHERVSMLWRCPYYRGTIFRVYMNFASFIELSIVHILEVSVGRRYTVNFGQYTCSQTYGTSLMKKPLYYRRFHWSERDKKTSLYLCNMDTLACPFGYHITGCYYNNSCSLPCYHNSSICKGNHMISSAMWDKSAQVYFSKANKIARAHRASAICSL